MFPIAETAGFPSAIEQSLAKATYFSFALSTRQLAQWIAINFSKDLTIFFGDKLVIIAQ